MSKEQGILPVLVTLVFTGLIVSARAQEVSLPDPALDMAIRATLQKPSGPLTEVDMLSLTNLDACCRSVASVEGLEKARNLVRLDLSNNSVTNFLLPSTWQMLRTLSLFNNHLTNFVVPGGLFNLTQLDLGFNALSQCMLPDGLTNLDTLFLEGNLLTNFFLPRGLTGLHKLDLAANALTSLSLPAEMTNLVNLLLFANRLTNVTFPDGLNGLSGLLLDFNQLHHLELPAGLTNLGRLSLLGNQLTNLTLPPDLTALTTLFVDGNPLASFVLSEPLAATNLAELVSALRVQGVVVSIYPIATQLVQARVHAGAFAFDIIGPPGIYVVLSSPELGTWSELGVATNTFGRIQFNDLSAALAPRKFYLVRTGDNGENRD